MSYRIEATIVRDDVKRIHSLDNVTAANIEQARTAYETRTGDGMTFVENATGITWFYFWHEIRDVQFIPQD